MASVLHSYQYHPTFPIQNTTDSIQKIELCNIQMKKKKN